MMKIISKLQQRWKGIDHPVIIHSDDALSFSQIEKQAKVDLSNINAGDVVALIGDFDPQSISTLLRLIDKNAIIVPLTLDTKPQHDYFFNTALVDVVIAGSSIQRINHSFRHELIEQLRAKKHSGLIFIFNRHNRAAESNIA